MVSESYNCILKKDINYIQHFGFSPEDLDILLSFQHDHILMRHYHIYHDCGKPYCLIQDENGAIHYPEHELISAQIHAQYFDCPEANLLIMNDMIFHKSNATAIEESIGVMLSVLKHSMLTC